MDIETLLHGSIAELIRKENYDTDYDWCFELYASIHTLEKEFQRVEEAKYADEARKEDRKKLILSKIDEINKCLNGADTGVNDIQPVDKIECNKSNKPRKKLIPLVRETNEALLLIYALLKNYDISYLDELSAVKGWGLIISGDFKNELIKKLPETVNGELELKGGEKYNRSDFCEKYRKRFK